MTPDDFWSSTLDECILTFKGKVDEWRFFRNGFNLIHCSLVNERANMLQVLPLPFDNELQEEKGDTLSLIEEYKKLKESGVLDG